MLKRLLYFICCATSIGALLAKCYGVMEMQTAAWLLMAPGTAVLLYGYGRSLRPGREELRAALGIGFAGGILGTLFYDLARIPFHIYGFRIFAPIAAYGVWLSNAGQSTRWTDVLGWCYHFSNGITFAIMYALFMRGRHWSLAIVWACLLETLAIQSPFGRMFALRGNTTAIVIAYLGHVAYGIPLGLFVQRWEETRRQLATLPSVHAAFLLAIGAGLLIAPGLLPFNVERDARARAQVLRVEGKTLNPDWLRVELGVDVTIENTESVPVIVRIPKLEREQELAPAEKMTFQAPRPGIYQLYVKHPLRTQSSFVMIEPVERE